MLMYVRLSQISVGLAGILITSRIKIGTITHMKYAPILVSVYNRENHFKDCIESLQRCQHAKQSHLYIAIDAPFRDQDIIANNNILEYSNSIKGFEKVTLLIRDTNMGGVKNRDLAREEVFKSYDSLIMLEDDNVFSTDFLNYMNTALEKYKDDPEIFSINGYNYPIEIPEQYESDIYIWQGVSGWGLGIWKTKWQSVAMKDELPLKVAVGYINNWIHAFKINRVANVYLEALINMLQKKQLQGDVYLSAYHIVNDMYSVFPVISRVRNIGHDGSGENCADLSTDNIYLNQPIHSSESPSCQLPDIIEPDKLIDAILRKHFRIGLLRQVKVLVKLIVRRYSYSF